MKTKTTSPTPSQQSFASARPCGAHFIGIDYHKRFSVFCVLDAAGAVQDRGRIEHSEPEAFARLLKKWPGRTVFEATMNWHWLYELLEPHAAPGAILLANPHKTRIIAEAQVKTDKVDALILAKLLRADLVSTVHIPAKETRQRKEVLRQRCFFVRQRTMVRNRIQRLLGGLHGIALPVVTDLFGKKGMAALEALVLPAPAGLLLKQQIEMLRTLQLRIKEDEAALGEMMDSVPGYSFALTLPGMGPVLAAVAASEIDDISRFGTAQKFTGYAGLCPRTSSSGGKTHHGGLFSACNKWLRWALIEASWVAIGCSPYFGELYRQRRAGGKLPNVAITCVARRMARILWQMLTKGRAFEKLPPQAKNPGPEEAGGHAPPAPSVSEVEGCGEAPPPAVARTVKHFPSRSGRGLAGLRG